MQHLSSYSQSYPTQRIEGKDTVVVMTLQQAKDINDVFATLREQKDSLITYVDTVTVVVETVTAQLEEVKKEKEVEIQQMQEKSSEKQDKVKKSKNTQIIGIIVSLTTIILRWITLEGFIIL
jgi:folylpolyglutamate synthase/dihydropteroate synthase